ncbi:MAG: MucR family transcriptional regulator [Alphaproteobacteria bacterium]|nr:MucR family transcriptional regulator [Alphaproteobacteria bacterium]
MSGTTWFAATDLPVLITTVGLQLAVLAQSHAESPEEKPVPAVSIKHSVRENEIVCLGCGKAQQMLERHPATRHHLNLDGNRTMFGLMDGYALVAPAYAATHSTLAGRNGLGRKPVPSKPVQARRTRPAYKTVAKNG